MSFLDTGLLLIVAGILHLSVFFLISSYLIYGLFITGIGPVFIF